MSGLLLCFAVPGAGMALVFLLCWLATPPGCGCAICLGDAEAVAEAMRK